MQQKKQKPSKRTNSRYAAVKALYSYEINSKSTKTKSPDELTSDIINYYNETKENLNKNTIDEKLVASILEGVCNNIADIDKIISENLNQNWKLERLSLVLKCILRAAIYELLNFTDISGNIIINEYVNITHSFSDEKEVGFINGILDNISQNVRGQTDE